jgi:hypothetical protein
MGAYIENESSIIQDAPKGVLAFRNPAGEVEVWDEEAETFYGKLPGNATPALIEAAMYFYDRGEDRGTATGRETARREIRIALGLKE